MSFTEKGKTGEQTGRQKNISKAPSEASQSRDILETFRLKIPSRQS